LVFGKKITISLLVTPIGLGLFLPLQTPVGWLNSNYLAVLAQKQQLGHAM
jgi:hypothetical protein